jgi:predicted RecA/RadA family phage recombinase
MPTYIYSATGHSAGEECSSTYEGRHLTFEESLITHPYHADGLVDSKDPVNVGDIVGVAFTGASAATDQIAIDTEGIWYLNVVASDDNGTSAVAAGDQLYINTGVISKKASGIPFGKACSVLSGSASAAVAAVKVHCEMRDVGDASVIVVSTKGNDTTGNGSWDAPLETLTAALALASTTRKTIYMLPGEYVEAAAITWPAVNEVRVIGLDEGGNVVISGPGAASAVLTINPTFTAATFEAFLENVCIEHTAQIGIEIDNANMTRKLLVHLIGVSTSQVSTGDSINVTHTTAGQAIRIYAKRCDEIEGLVDIIVANTDDRFRFEACTLIGGLDTTGAVAGELTLLHTVVLTNTLTPDAANVLTYVGSCYRTDAGVYTQLADTYSS